MKLHLFAVAQYARNRWHNITEISTLELNKLLMDTSDDKQALDQRLKLKAQLRTLVTQIKVYPLLEDYEPYREIEPGVHQWMKSKSMERIFIRFAGAKKLQFINLKSYAEGFVSGL